MRNVTWRFKDSLSDVVRLGTGGDKQVGEVKRYDELWVAYAEDGEALCTWGKVFQADLEEYGKILQNKKRGGNLMA